MFKKPNTHIFEDLRHDVARTKRNAATARKALSALRKLAADASTIRPNRFCERSLMACAQY